MAAEEVDGQLTICSDAEWQVRLAELESVLTPGLHTFTTTSRGMASPKTMRVTYRGKGTNFKERRVSINLGAPRPVLV